MSPKTLAILNWVALILMLTVNTLANTLPINGYNTGEVSAFYPNLFVPDGFTFSIWSVIYLLLIGFVLISTKWLWHKEDAVPGRLAAAIAPLFMITCLLNASWILAWHYLQVIISVIIMLAFLGMLIYIYQKLQSYRTLLSPFQKLFLYTPFVVYLGWISVATIANITALLVHYKWEGGPLSESAWSIIMISIASLLAMIFIWKKSDRAYALVIAWALLGIYRGQGDMTPAIGYAALAGIVTILLLGVLRLRQATRI
jgi:translocator protein